MVLIEYVKTFKLIEKVEILGPNHNQQTVFHSSIHGNFEIKMLTNIYIMGNNLRFSKIDGFAFKPTIHYVLMKIKY